MPEYEKESLGETNIYKEFNISLTKKMCVKTKKEKNVRIRGFHLTVGGGVMSLLECWLSRALGSDGNFSVIRTEDCKYN